jgi:hypothetical protein
MLEDVGTDGIGKHSVFEGEMVCIGHDNRTIDDNIAATFGIIKQKFVDKNIGAWVGIITTADFEDQALGGRIQVLFHAYLIQFIARKAVVEDV